MSTSSPADLRAKFGEATAWLERSRRPVLVSHRRPDSDALGSLAGMALLLQEWNISPKVLLFDPIPARYEGMFGTAGEWITATDGVSAHLSKADGLIILDTCSYSQLEPMRDALTNPPRTLVIDHHSTNDPIGTRPGDLRVIDATAGANCLLLYELAAAANVRMRPETANALFLGIAADTGWFKYSNTDGRLLRAAAALTDLGARSNELFERTCQQDPPAKLRLISRMLDSLELHADDRLALMKLRRADFAAAGADDSMTEDLVNEASRVGSVDATILITEDAAEGVRANFRSKRLLNVSALAQKFGGGGHVRAAGARIREPLDSVAPRLVAEAVSMLREEVAKEAAR
jgi:phosphoesterase RecJ-like protein